MAFAVFVSGGKQYRVQPGDVVEVERLEGVEPGPTTFSDVLMVEGADGLQVGQPTVAGAEVQAQVLGHIRGPKIRVFTYQAKKRHRRRLGHRQPLTRVRIEAIGPRGAGSDEAETRAAPASAGAD